MAGHRIAVIPGDGIGKEVVPEGIKVINAAGECEGIRFEFAEFPWGCEHYLKHSELMPESALDELAQFDAIYLGAVGMPDVVPEEVAVRGLVLRIRFGFDQFANVRPIRPLPGGRFILNHVEPQSIDLVVVRENTEGMYLGLGRRYPAGTPEFQEYSGLRPSFSRSSEIAVQTGIYSEAGCRRVMEFAFDLATRRDGLRRVTSATKANALNFGMTLWNELFEDVARCYPGIRADWQNVDAMAMRLMLEPEAYDVIVAPNLFGDILTDLTAVLQGGLGMCAGANLSVTGPSMFEPPHGSAPDIAGKGIANPTAAILTGAMMLEHLGHPHAAARVEAAVGEVLRGGSVLTRDLGGTASTSQFADAVVSALGR